MTRTAAMIGGLVMTMAAAIVPPPQQVLHHPKFLYGAAMVKAAVGDANSALQLLQRSTERAPAPARVRSASTCSPQSRG
ncbi:MAG: hypothetical protein ACRD3E_07775 [Terriglobales bacterium]